MNTFEKLEKLAEINDFLATYETAKNDTKDALMAEQQRLIDSILTPEILAKVDEIKAEFQPKFDALESDEKYNAKKAEAEALTAEIKAEVIAAGKTVKGSCLQAVFTKVRVSWDDKGLSGFMLAHPEIEVYRKVGDPSVSIRKVAQ